MNLFCEDALQQTLKVHSFKNECVRCKLLYVGKYVLQAVLDPFTLVKIPQQKYRTTDSPMSEKWVETFIHIARLDL